ncbi:MAG: tetratricopeptide repeat protein [Gemmatimonadaceae bacterium]
MSNALKLKKKAAELEQKRQFDKALALYIEVLEEASEEEQAQEVNLYNRVGDLLVRQGNVADACNYYEKAVDLYSEGGFFNNAIALCNKILRTAPGRNSIYYKLGKISAKKGFKSDARQNFLEYADRMQKAGKMDEAFRALKEFADLSPDQEDIRLMLAEQFSKKGLRDEAVDQLQHLYEKLQSEGRSTEAKATAERMQAIDPNVTPRDTGSTRTQKSNDLVFLDLSADVPPERAVPPPAAPSRPATGPRGTVPMAPMNDTDLPLLDTTPLPAAAGGLPLLDTSEPEPRRETVARAEPALEAPTDVGGDLGAGVGMDAGFDVNLGSGLSLDTSPGLGGNDYIGGDFVGGDFESNAAGPGALDGFESSSGFGASSLAGTAGGDMLGLEPTSNDSAERAELRAGGLLDLEAPIEQSPPLAVSEFANLPLDAASVDRASPPPAHDLALPGELPMLDLPHDESASDDDLPLMLSDTPSESGAGDLPMLDVDGPATPAISSASPATDMPPHARPTTKVPATDISPPELDLAANLGVTPIGTPVEINPGDIDPREAAAARIAASANAARRRSASTAVAQSVETLRADAQRDPADWGTRRRLAEALLESGDRDAGLRELDAVLVGYERANDLESARSVAEEIIRVDPASVRHHQKRVEYAFRANDKPRLVEAYMSLADALVRAGQSDKARAVYQRVLDLAPDDIRAQAALSAYADVPAEPPPARRSTAGPASRASSADARVAPAGLADVPAVGGDAGGDFVNLGDWLREDEGPKSTRMVTEEREPTGDEQADFADMLKRFKQGVAENVDEEDYASHYDLGVAYKEMGLVDEAIAEFQKALRSPELKIRTYEALGQCFIEKEQFQVASTILARALGERGVGDDQLVGVLYLLGFANEANQKKDDAVAYYQRVFAVDIQFRDVADRLNALDKAAR